jgi:AcrR family transcriptional regulator
MGNNGVQRRRRRTREETRELLLSAAVRLVEARVAGDDGASVNPLADVVFTDVLEEANRDEGADGRTMTTGAVYNIWPSQAEFQADLLARILDEAATPGIDRVRAATLDGLARRAPWRAVLAETIEIDFRESFAEPSMFAMIGLAALAAPADVADAQGSANARYVAETGELLAAIVRYAGRRLRKGRSMDDLVWAIEALESGYLLRMRVNAEIPLREAADGESALAAAAAGVVEAFTEEDVA